MMVKRLCSKTVEQEQVKAALLGYCMKRGLNEKISGNEVYHTACSLLVTLKNSCSKRFC